jgi:hypothetical protein
VLGHRAIGDVPLHAEAAETRKQQIQHDDVRLPSLDGMERLIAIRRFHHLEPREGQRGCEHLPQRRIVLDDEDCRSFIH